MNINDLDEDRVVLSRHKYIYVIYIGKDMKLYIERYPVVYINGTYAYFKTFGTDYLFSIHRCNVYDDISYITCIQNRDPKTDKTVSVDFYNFVKRAGKVYLWKSPKDDSLGIVEKSKRISIIEDLTSRIDKIDNAIEINKRRISQSYEAIEEAKKTIEELNQERASLEDHKNKLLSLPEEE